MLTLEALKDYQEQMSAPFSMRPIIRVSAYVTPHVKFTRVSTASAEIAHKSYSRAVGKGYKTELSIEGTVVDSNVEES